MYGVKRFAREWLVLKLFQSIFSKVACVCVSANFCNSGYIWKSQNKLKIWNYIKENKGFQDDCVASLSLTNVHSKMVPECIPNYCLVMQTTER